MIWVGNFHEPEDIGIKLNWWVPDLESEFLAIRELMEFEMLFSPQTLFSFFLCYLTADNLLIVDIYNWMDLKISSTIPSFEFLGPYKWIWGHWKVWKHAFDRSLGGNGGWLLGWRRNKSRKKTKLIFRFNSLDRKNSQLGGSGLGVDCGGFCGLRTFEKYKHNKPNWKCNWKFQKQSNWITI